MYPKHKLTFWALIVVAFVVGITAAWLFRDIAGQLTEVKVTTTSYDIDLVKRRSAALGINIPEKAWDVNFHMIIEREVKVTSCYLAFSANDDEIEKIITKLEYFKNSNKIIKLPPPPLDENGIALTWWNRMPSNRTLEIYQGENYWLAYDKSEPRMYVYICKFHE